MQWNLGLPFQIMRDQYLKITFSFKSLIQIFPCYMLYMKESRFSAVRPFLLSVLWFSSLMKESDIVWGDVTTSKHAKRCSNSFQKTLLIHIHQTPLDPDGRKSISTDLYQDLYIGHTIVGQWIATSLFKRIRNWIGISVNTRRTLGLFQSTL